MLETFMRREIDVLDAVNNAMHSRGEIIVIVVVCHSNHFTQNTQQQKHRIDKYTLLINNHYYIHQSN
jgi:hypothetical protein